MRPKVVAGPAGPAVEYRLVRPACAALTTGGLVVGALVLFEHASWSDPLVAVIVAIVLLGAWVLATWVVTLDRWGVRVDRLARSRAVAWGDVDLLLASSYRGSAKLWLRTVHRQGVSVLTFADQGQVLALLRLAAQRGLVPAWVDLDVAGHPGPIPARDWRRLGDSFWLPLGDDASAREGRAGRHR